MSPRKYRTALNPTGCIDGPNLFGTSQNYSIPLTNTYEPFKPLGVAGIIQGNGTCEPSIRSVTTATTADTTTTTSPKPSNESVSEECPSNHSFSTQQSSKCDFSGTSTRGKASRGALLIAEAANAIKFPASTTTLQAQPPVAMTVNPTIGMNAEGNKRSKASVSATAGIEKPFTAKEKSTTSTDMAAIQHISSCILNTDALKKDQDPNSALTSPTASPSTSTSSVISSPTSNNEGSIKGVGISSSGGNDNVNNSTDDDVHGDNNSSLFSEASFSLGVSSAVTSYSAKPVAHGHISKRRGFLGRSKQKNSSPVHCFAAYDSTRTDTSYSASSAPLFTTLTNSFAAASTNSSILGSTSSTFGVPTNPFSSTSGDSVPPSDLVGELSISSESSASAQPTEVFTKSNDDT